MLTAEHSLMFMLYLTDKYSPSPIFCQQKGGNKRKKRRKKPPREMERRCPLIGRGQRRFLFDLCDDFLDVLHEFRHVLEHNLDNHCPVDAVVFMYQTMAQS